MSSATPKEDYNGPTGQHPDSLSMSPIVAVEDVPLSRQRLQALTHMQPAARRRQRTPLVAGALQTSFWLIILAAGFILHMFVIRLPRCSKGASHPSSTDSTGGADGTTQTQLQESPAATSPRTRSDDGQEKAQRAFNAIVLGVSVLLLTANLVLLWHAKHSGGDPNFVPVKHQAASISLTDMRRRIPSEIATATVMGHQTFPPQLNRAATAALFAASMFATWFLKNWIENGVPRAPWGGAFEGNDNGNPREGDPDTRSGFAQPLRLELQGGPPPSETSPTDGSATESAQGLPGEEGNEQGEDTLERWSSDLEDEEPIFPAWFEEPGTSEGQPSVVLLEGDESVGPDRETAGTEKPSASSRGDTDTSAGSGWFQGDYNSGNCDFLTPSGAAALANVLLTAGSSAVAQGETDEDIQSYLEELAQLFHEVHQDQFLRLDVKFKRGDTLQGVRSETLWWARLRETRPIRRLQLEHPVGDGILMATIYY